MIKKEVIFGERYQLRYAAGRYWLLDMMQDELSYKPPLSMNEVGADILKMIFQRMSTKEIAELLSKEYDILEESAKEDVIQFRNELMRFGITIEE